MAYSDPATVHDPSPGAVIPSTWGDAVNADVAFLYARDPSYSVVPSAVAGITTTETIIATLAVPAQPGTYETRMTAAVYFTGTNGDSFLLRIRRGTTIAGTLLWSQLAVVAGAGAAHPSIVEVVDTIAAGAAQSYVLTLIRTGGAGSATTAAFAPTDRFRAYAHAV